MSDLIKAAVSIKDPFTLFAFLALLLLIAFRTKSVPEALFKLVGDKMTRERFSQQMRRAFLYVFLAFLALCGLAGTGQVLGYMTTAKAASVDELKQELALRRADDGAARQAMEEYQRGLAQAEDQKLSDAIASLEASVKAVPTAAAQETLALLYQKAGESRRAVQVAGQAVSTAREAGDAVRTAKAERVLSTVSASGSAPVTVSKSCPSGAALVGPKLDLPPGGDHSSLLPRSCPAFIKASSIHRMDSGSTTGCPCHRDKAFMSSCGRGMPMPPRPIFDCTDRMAELWADIPPSVKATSPHPSSTRPTRPQSFSSVSLAACAVRLLTYRYGSRWATQA
ncbi:MAG TPA: hypothetical protein VJP02_25775 [Candidatus Sulfotelmatobacter sp.]|nr:hypothetical protein [Candidatus Sulfotelmatobacter sp.]